MPLHKNPIHTPVSDRAGGWLCAGLTDSGAGHGKRIITEMTDVGFSQSASSSLNSYLTPPKSNSHRP